MEGYFLVAIKAERENQQVMSPMGAPVEIHDITQEEIAMILAAWAQGRVQATNWTKPCGIQDHRAAW